jgi:acyl carrier protein
MPSSDPADYSVVRSVIVEWLDDNVHFGDAESLITDDEMSFLENGVLDSLGFVQLILHIEGRFSVALDRKDLTRDNFDGMRKIIAYVTACKGFTP